MLRHYLKSIVVDDERPSREALINYAQEFCPEVEIVAECKNTKSAYEAIKNHAPQLVFLDIEMPKGSGIDLLKMFSPIPFKVIFITAFSDYAVEAFRYSASDFLLKPLKVHELIEAVLKVRNELNIRDAFQNLEVLLENFGNAHLPDKKLVLRHINGFTVINTANIIMCRADRYCTIFHMENGEAVSSTHNLRYYEDLLPGDQFMRVHNSYLINLNHVCNYNTQGFIGLSGNHKCSLSAARKTEFLRFFKNGHQ